MSGAAWFVAESGDRIDHGVNSYRYHKAEGWADLVTAVTDAARLRSLAATFDSHLNRDHTYKGSEVASMLRGEG